MFPLYFLAIELEEPECRVDKDCPPQMTCMRETCQNPCIVSNPCIGSQKCVVKDNFSSLRSVACECPEGLIYGGNGECIHGTGENECSRNEDCRISEVCHTGTCINACLVFKCAPYATCQTTVHDVQCTCISGYTGDGKIACDRSKFLVLSQIVCTITYTYVIIPFSIINLVPPGAVEPVSIGCISNDDCPDHAACRNSACINPCALDNPCAPNANCKVLGHEPVCTCPDGYIGSPTTECRLRKYRYGWVLISGIDNEIEVIHFIDLDIIRSNNCLVLQNCRISHWVNLEDLLI